MVGDMENYKVLVNNEAESREVQDLFFELGGDFYFGGKLHCNTHSRLVTINKDGLMANLEFDGFDYVEITLQQLRDLVVLKRNDVLDATHYYGGSRYYLTGSEFYQYSENNWVNIDEYVDGMTFKKIEKEVKMKEYIAKVSGDWRLVESNELVSGRIEVPEGAEIFLLDKSCGEDILFFVKHDGEVFHEYYISGTDIQNNTWIKGTIKELHKGMGKVLWQRNPEPSKTSIQEKLKFIEKWLNGEKIQYILGVESDKIQSEKTQPDESKWHNFTECAMQYIKRSDIKFREAPKYVTINGIEFKNVKSLLKHVKNNFDLEDGE